MWFVKLIFPKFGSLVFFFFLLKSWDKVKLVISTIWFVYMQRMQYNYFCFKPFFFFATDIYDQIMAMS